MTHEEEIRHLAKTNPCALLAPDAAKPAEVIVAEAYYRLRDELEKEKADHADTQRQWNEALNVGLKVVQERDAYRRELERLQKRVGADDHARIYALLNP